MSAPTSLTSLFPFAPAEKALAVAEAQEVATRRAHNGVSYQDLAIGGPPPHETRAAELAQRVSVASAQRGTTPPSHEPLGPLGPLGPLELAPTPLPPPHTPSGGRRTPLGTYARAASAAAQPLEAGKQLHMLRPSSRQFAAPGGRLKAAPPPGSGAKGAGTDAAAAATAADASSAGVWEWPPRTPGTPGKFPRTLADAVEDAGVLRRQPSRQTLSRQSAAESRGLLSRQSGPLQAVGVRHESFGPEAWGWAPPARGGGGGGLRLANPSAEELAASVVDAAPAPPPDAAVVGAGEPGSPTRGVAALEKLRGLAQVRDPRPTPDLASSRRISA